MSLLWSERRGRKVNGEDAMSISAFGRILGEAKQNEHFALWKVTDEYQGRFKGQRTVDGEK